MSTLRDLSSLEKGLAVLRELAASDGSLTAGQLASATGLNRTTIYRLCDTLERDGWATRVGDDASTARFELGVAAHGLAVLITSKYDTEARLRPVISELSHALGTTVHVGTLEGSQVVHIARSLPPEGMSVAARVGTREHAHCAGIGKALLAALPDEAFDQLYPDEQLPTRTPRSIGTRSELRRELERIRAAGSALDDEEGTLGIKCVAAPVFAPGGRGLFALSVTSVPSRLQGQELEEATAAVRAAAARLTASFGGLSPT